jgi:hypothetical protein
LEFKREPAVKNNHALAMQQKHLHRDSGAGTANGEYPFWKAHVSGRLKNVIYLVPRLTSKFTRNRTTLQEAYLNNHCYTKSTLESFLVMHQHHSTTVVLKHRDGAEGYKSGPFIGLFWWEKVGKK